MTYPKLKVFCTYLIYFCAKIAQLSGGHFFPHDAVCLLFPLSSRPKHNNKKKTLQNDLCTFGFLFLIMCLVHIDHSHECMVIIKFLPTFFYFYYSNWLEIMSGEVQTV